MPLEDTDTCNILEDDGWDPDAQRNDIGVVNLSSCYFIARLCRPPETQAYDTVFVINFLKLAKKQRNQPSSIY